jgi:hypothetical protein
VGDGWVAGATGRSWERDTGLLSCLPPPQQLHHICPFAWSFLVCTHATTTLVSQTQHGNNEIWEDVRYTGDSSPWTWRGASWNDGIHSTTSQVCHAFLQHCCPFSTLLPTTLLDSFEIWSCLPHTHSNTRRHTHAHTHAHTHSHKQTQ